MTKLEDILERAIGNLEKQLRGPRFKEPTKEQLLAMIQASQDHQRERLSQGEAIIPYEEMTLERQIDALLWAKRVYYAMMEHQHEEGGQVRADDGEAGAEGSP